MALNLCRPRRRDGFSALVFVTRFDFACSLVWQREMREDIASCTENPNLRCETSTRDGREMTPRRTPYRPLPCIYAPFLHSPPFILLQTSFTAPAQYSKSSISL